MKRLKKMNLSLFVIKHHAINAYYGGGTTARIIKLGSKKALSFQFYSPAALAPGKEITITILWGIGLVLGSVWTR
jgi:hypothetical protein